MKFRILVANTAKYLKGEDDGTWLTLPVNFKMMSKKLGLDSSVFDYTIFDNNLPLVFTASSPIVEYYTAKK